ncbi:hypothetical protein SeMB42_g02265 [Synchytrium endobioticum]|uniref:Uncharacterized protein n=1 Tax=Synchytrium endobioticum TaxID=286115 RepID=A0A507DHS3_9FUNG|nr:hypothetical protein SeLEV6574_g02643 [Synchytrium endobioticum]TPX50390.1 hypothetical protein SeMB42_g02265 [Synchytrium endobioticum]
MASVDEDLSKDSRTVTFLAKTGNVSFQIWKETEPEFYWYLEKNFKAYRCSIKLTADEKVYAVETEMPNDQVGKFQKAFNSGLIATELDKMHGLDPTVRQRDAKLTRLTVTAGTVLPQNLDKSSVAALEARLLELELHERARSIDIRAIMEKMQALQLDMFKKLEATDKKVDQNAHELSWKCEKSEAALKKYRAK